MGRRAKRCSLSIWMNGQLLGTWTRTARGGQEFAYAAEWLQSAAARPLSLSMPLRPPGEPYKDERVTNFFDNLLPDNESIRLRMQRKFRTDSTEPFSLLAETGRDCAGAIQLLPEGAIPANVQQIQRKPLNAQEVEKLLDDTLAAPMGQQDPDDEFRISIAGAQEKTALLWYEGGWNKPLGSTPTTHIFKLPLGKLPQGIDLTTSVENEWLCAQILGAYDVDVAHCEIQQFGRYKVLSVERFDRRYSDDGKWLVRLPQEDLCQATRTPPAWKYEADGGPGIQQIMQLLLGSNNAHEDRLEFLRTLVVFWLLCAIDGHAKNFSIFLLPGGGYRLTPRYDILSAYPILGGGAGQYHARRVKMAMALTGEKNRHYHWATIHYTHWLETARLCGMQENIRRIINEVLARTPSALAEVEKKLPADFSPEVADRIFKGVRNAAQTLTRQRDALTTERGTCQVY